MTSKIKALIAAALTAIAGFLNWLCTLPPEQQEGFAAQLVELVPLNWRPIVGVWTRTLVSLMGFYAIYAASHSGPQTPPKNPPTE